jgi:hypothetical protein
VGVFVPEPGHADRLIALIAGRSSSETRVAAYDGETFERLWESEPVWTGGEPVFGVAGTRVIVSDFYNTLVVDRVTGKTMHKMKLDAKPNRICSGSGSSARLEYEGRTMLLDLATYAVKDGESRRCPESLVGSDKTVRVEIKAVPNGGGHLVAVDKKSARVLWDTFIPGTADGSLPKHALATDKRVYLEPEFLVFDRKTGEYLGRFNP